MRFYKKLSVFIGLMCLLSLAVAAPSSIAVKSAELLLEEENYMLNADFELNFDESIEEALNKGVPLTFLIEFQIVKPYKYWFDDEVLTISKSVSINYHALTRQYLVNYDAHQKSFETLSEARQALMHITHWKVAKKEDLDKGETYKAAILMRLDKSKLPKAIQVDTLSSEDWSLASPVFTWSLKDIK